MSSNATIASHGLYKLEIVVIADSRMLALYLYFLINHIQFRSDIDGMVDTEKPCMWQGYHVYVN